MLTTLKTNRSLTFYQPTASLSKNTISSSHTGGIASAVIANSSMVTAMTTTRFTTQLNGFLNSLNAKRASDAASLDLSVSNQTARNRGVARAWEYENADIQMGGKGSANWTYEEQQEILEHGKVRHKTMPDGKKDGPVGHHELNVSDHPDQQANPDYIKFYKNLKEHLDKGHNGKWNNKSDARIIEKNKMLKRTNAKRVFKNELKGLGIAVAIGLGVGFTIGFAVTLAQSGITPESLKLATIEGAKGSTEACALSAVGYGISRSIGEIAAKAVIGMLGNHGVNITENIIKMCNIAVVGILTIAVFSVYQFLKLKHQGLATRDSLMQVGKQVLFSLTLLAVSIAAQGIWGGPAGIIVSVSIGIIFITYSLAETVHTRKFSEKVRIYMIDKCRPAY